MLNDQRARAIAIAIANTSRSNNTQEDNDNQDRDELPTIRDELPTIREIHALTPPRASRGPQRESWETSSHRSSSLSMASSNNEGSENFTTMSREFSALVTRGSTIGTENETIPNYLERIREDESLQDQEGNPLAIVADNSSWDPVQSPRDANSRSLGHGDMNSNVQNGGEASVQRVKREEVETKISAWQNAKIAKINNRFKREDVIIAGLEGEQVQKATSWMKKVERKLEEKRAKALEKMQNDIAQAHRKAEEKRASAEAKRGTKVAKILEIANLMRAIGRPPVKRSFF